MNAKELFRRGWTEIVPIIPPDGGGTAPGKCPGIRLPNGEWRPINAQQVKATSQDCQDWDNMGANLAIRTRFFPVLDVDVMSKPLADTIRDHAISSLGQTHCRYGQRPKLGLIYRTKTPFKKSQINFKDTDGVSHSIEFKAEGANFNIYGLHPSGVPYEWDKDLDDPSSLSLIDETKVDNFVVSIKQKLKDLGCIFKESEIPSVTLNQSKLAPNRECVVHALSVIPNTDEDFANRSDIVDLSHAIKGALGYDGSPVDAAGEDWEMFRKFVDSYEDGINEPEWIEQIWISTPLSEELGWPKLKYLATKYDSNFNNWLASQELTVVEVDDVAPVNALAVAKPYSNTDVAERFLQQMGDRIRVKANSKASHRKFLIRVKPTDCKWTTDEINRVEDAVRKFCVQLGCEAVATLPPREANLTYQALCNSQEGVMRQIKTFSNINILPADCDQDKNVICTPSGLVDLKTGRNIDITASSTYHTKQTSCSPDWTCPTPLFDSFLNFALEKNELIKLLQTFMGYALTGHTREQIFLFAYGGGGTGKGMFIRIMEALFGDYMDTVQPRVFLRDPKGNDSNRHLTEFTDFDGMRLIVAQEFPDDAIWNEGNLKTLTGSDTIKARRMHQDGYSFAPTHTIFLAGNRLPSIKTVDDAIRRRVRLIPFKKKASEEMIAQNYEDRIKAEELPGILAWAIDGAIRWYNHGMGEMPEGVESETSEYLTNADEFSLWLEEHTKTDTTQTQGWRTPIPILYDSWRNFMVQCGYTTNQLDTKKTFKEKMREKGYKENRTAAARVYDHIQYLDPTETGATLCSHCMGSGRQPLGAS